MLIAHKVIDALVGTGELIPIPGTSKHGREHMAQMIRAAQKFDFGDLLLEPIPKNEGHWLLPRLSDDEMDWWRGGLIPLPFQTVWYEFVIGQTRSAVLVYEPEPDIWKVERIEYVNKQVLYDGVACVVQRSTAVQSDKPRDTTLGVDYQGLFREAVAHEAAVIAGFPGWISPDKKLKLKLEGNDEFLHVMRGSSDFIRDNLGMNVPLAIYLTLMLSSRTTEVRQAPPESPKLNKARIKRGKEPLPSHRIVRIVPESFRKASVLEGYAQRRAPRLHWRRSHLRHYDHRVPSAQWSEQLDHEGRKGWWVTVIARQLVGRSELGEVSHDYFIGSITKENKDAA